MEFSKSGSWLLDLPITAAFIAGFLIFSTYRKLRSTHKNKLPAKLLVVLGSGGHTRELLVMLKNLSLKNFSPIVYVHSDNDILSAQKAAALEVSRHNHDYELRPVPRSRAVGQSYFTSIFTTLYSFLFSFKIVWNERPEMILCTGPGVCVPIMYSAFVLKIFAGRPCSLIFVESVCRVETLSLTGKLVQPIVDEFVVQWDEMQKKFDGTKYIGRIC